MAHSLHLFYLMRLRHVKDGKTAKENAIPLSRRVTAERIAENTRVASRTSFKITCALRSRGLKSAHLACGKALSLGLALQRHGMYPLRMNHQYKLPALMFYP